MPGSGWDQPDPPGYGAAIYDPGPLDADTDWRNVPGMHVALGLCVGCLTGVCKHDEHPYEGGVQVLADTSYNGNSLCKACATGWVGKHLSKP